jgi:hypothetical protein
MNRRSRIDPMKPRASKSLAMPGRRRLPRPISPSLGIEWNENTDVKRPPKEENCPSGQLRGRPKDDHIPRLIKAYSHWPLYLVFSVQMRVGAFRCTCISCLGSRSATQPTLSHRVGNGMLAGRKMIIHAAGDDGAHYWLRTAELANGRG